MMLGCPFEERTRENEREEQRSGRPEKWAVERRTVTFVGEGVQEISLPLRFLGSASLLMMKRWSWSRVKIKEVKRGRVKPLDASLDACGREFGASIGECSAMPQLVGTNSHVPTVEAISHWSMTRHSSKLLLALASAVSRFTAPSGPMA
jgi:hypothetical protein